MHGDFVANLVSVKPGSLERGDTVYEIVRWGNREGDYKYKKLKVIDSDGGTASVVDFDAKPGGMSRKIRYAELRMEKPPERPKKAPSAQVVRAVATRRTEANNVAMKPIGDDFQAWLEIGRGLVGEMEANRSSLDEKKSALERELARIDAEHCAHIEQLEAALAATRDAHTKARAFVVSGLEHVNASIESLHERRKGLQTILGD